MRKQKFGPQPIPPEDAIDLLGRVLSILVRREVKSRGLATSAADTKTNPLSKPTPAGQRIAVSKGTR